MQIYIQLIWAYLKIAPALTRGWRLAAFTMASTRILVISLRTISKGITLPPLNAFL